MTVRRLLSIVAAVLLAAVLAASILVHVPSGTVAVLSWRGGGTPRLIQPGVAVRIPVVQRVDRYPHGVLALAGRIEVASREGSALTLPYRLQARPEPQHLLDLYQEGGGAGALGAVRADLESRLRKAAAATALYDLASGSAGVTLAPLIARAMEGRLGPGAILLLEPAELPPDIRASLAKEAVYGKYRPTDRRILLIGLDGADWDVIDPLIVQGGMPNLARLIREGTRARLRTNIPTLSPLLWTTVATGKAPDRHGINDFLVHDPRTGRRVPINSTFRKAKAFWNILTGAEIPCDVVAWWATWPAEAISGHLVSDRVAYSTFDLADPEVRQGAVHPVDYAARVAALRMPEEAVTHAQAARFLKIEERELQAARRRSIGAPGTGESEERAVSINVFARVLAATETYRRVALDLLDRAAHPAATAPGSPAPTASRLLAVYFQGLDEVQHRFAHCAPPRHPLCSAADYARFQRTVAEFHRYQDEILGDLLRRSRGWTVLLLSDHGFASGPGRPKDEKPFIEGKPGLWHDLTGIFVAAGPGVRRTQEIPTVTLYDVAPTLLHLLGLPVPEDMPGKVLEAALTPETTAAHPILRVPSYEGIGGDEGRPDAIVVGEAADGEIVEQLRSLGYIGGESAPAGSPSAGAPSPGSPSAGAPYAGSPAAGVLSTGAREAANAAAGGEVPTLLYHTNLGAVHLGKRQYDLAEAEFRKALAIDPGAIQALAGLAILHESRGEYEQALQTLRTAFRAPEADTGAILLKMAELYIRMGRPADGLEWIESGGIDARLPKLMGKAVAVGLLQQASGKEAEAEMSFLEALRGDPGSVPAMQELFSLYDAQGRAADLEPLLRRALAANPRSAMHLNWLGLVLRRRGDPEGAIAAFRAALEAAPDMTGAMANLGSVSLQLGRKDEAVATLRQALEQDPRSLESRINLIVALGLSGDADAARALFEEADQSGIQLPQIYNALAYAFYLNGRNDEALGLLRRSLQMQPDQADARRLQNAIEQGVAPGAF